MLEKIVLITLGTLFLSVEITGLYYLIEESKIVIPELNNFLSANLECSNSFLLFGCNNYGSNYPYKKIFLYYLCKEGVDFSSNGASKLDYPTLINEELADNSLSWAGLFLNSYIFLITTQTLIFVLVFIIFSFLLLKCCLGIFYPSWVSFLIVLNKCKIHGIFLTGFLMSIFIVFDFNKCLETKYHSSYEQIFTEKNYGFTLFIIGLGLLPFYMISCYASNYFISYAKTRNKKEYGIFATYAVFETLIFGQQVLLLVHWVNYYEKIYHKANKYHNSYLILSFIIEKLVIAFFWVYFWWFYKYQSISIIPIEQDPRSTQIVLTDHQRTALTQINNTAIFVENENSLRMYSIKGGPTCNICLDDIVKGEQISSLTCNHIFHHKCLQEWVKNNAYLSCPNCRAAIEPVEDPWPQLNTKIQFLSKITKKKIASRQSSLDHSVRSGTRNNMEEEKVEENKSDS